MNNPELSIIVAVAENGVIGKGNKLPWRIPEDLQRFQRLTKDQTVVMGRKTYQSLPPKSRPLPNRENIVITRDQNWRARQVLVAHSLPEALSMASREKVFVIGGGQIYEQALPLVSKLYLTVVHQNIDGDTYFPDYSEFNKEVFHEDHQMGDLKYTFLELVKSHSTS